MMISIKEGLPHSDIRGSTIARISPRLFAACHVLHRLLVPRHPPNALLILIHHRPLAGSIRAITGASRTTTCPIGQQQHRDTHLFHGEVSPAEHSISPTLLHHEKQHQKPPTSPEEHQGGFLEVPQHDQRSCAELVPSPGGDRIRTDDPLLAKQVL